MSNWKNIVTNTHIVVEKEYVYDIIAIRSICVLFKFAPINSWCKLLVERGNEKDTTLKEFGQ